jgi:hypothetical protein
MDKAMLLVVMALMSTLPRLAGADEDNPDVHQVTAPYVVGEWFLGDSSADTPSVTTDDTQFVFLNPTDHKQFNEYAFFDPDGNFCGCDRDVKNPGGRIRYTMSDEAAGGQFVCTGAPGLLAKQTEGTMKSIAFTVTSGGGLDLDGASQAGHQVHFGVRLGAGAATNTESILASVPVTGSTRNAIQAIHNQCVVFCNAHPANNCPALAP